MCLGQNDLYLAYFYTKESDKINDASNKIVSKRVGYYDVNKQNQVFRLNTHRKRDGV